MMSLENNNSELPAFVAKDRLSVVPPHDFTIPVAVGVVAVREPGKGEDEIVQMDHSKATTGAPELPETFIASRAA